jgi:hypothetical protein
MRKDPYTRLEPNDRVINHAQRLYLICCWNILIDLAVINLLDEYWDWIDIPSFTVSLGVAVVLQFGLLFCIQVEKKTSAYFMKKSSTIAKVLRGITSYLIISGGKFVIMGLIYFIFGYQVTFGGPWGGTIAFISLVAAVLVAEWASKIFFVYMDRSEEPVSA